MNTSLVVLLIATAGCELRGQRLPNLTLSPEACRSQADTQVPKWRAAGMRDTDVERAYQVVMGQCTGDFDVTTAVLIASMNVDMQRLGRMFLNGSLDTASYLARARDRASKLQRALKDPAYRNDLVRIGDEDGDLVPDNRDRCPHTADLSPTDMNGCPVTAQDAGAPNAQVVRQLLQSMSFVADANCTNSSAPDTPHPVKAGWGEHMANFAVARVGNQPPGCLLIYEIDFQAQVPGDPRLIFAELVFRDLEARPSATIPSSVARFQTWAGDPADAGNRKTAAVALLNYTNARWRVRAINGSGLRSPWSAWESLAGPPKDDALAPFNVP